MITDVVAHTFLIRYNNGTGTAFAINRGGKQYLITARHVVQGITSGQQIHLRKDEQWEPISIKVAGLGVGNTDIAVLATDIQLAPSHVFEVAPGGLGYAQAVYFLGFPFGWDGEGGDINNGFPLPFVKAGIVSAIVHTDATLIYIDGHGNKGFSGGPLVFVTGEGQESKLRIAGVVAKDPRPLQVPVVSESGTPLADERGEAIAYFLENQGLAECGKRVV